MCQADVSDVGEGRFACRDPGGPLPWPPPRSSVLLPLSGGPSVRGGRPGGASLSLDCPPSSLVWEEHRLPAHLRLSALQPAGSSVRHLCSG